MFSFVLDDRVDTNDNHQPEKKKRYEEGNFYNGDIVLIKILNY